MTRASVLVALVAALFLATAASLASRIVFENQEERVLHDSAIALAAAVRAERAEGLTLEAAGGESIRESALTNHLIEVYEGEKRIAASHPDRSIGMTAIDAVTKTREWLVVTVPIAEGVRLVVATPRDLGSRAWRIFAWSLFLAAPFAVGVALLIGRSAARRVTEPLVAFRDRFVAADPEGDVAEGSPDDPREVRELDTAFRQQWRRVRDGFDRERAFAANAAHELRTPLTRLLLLAEQAKESSNEPERRATLERQVDEITRLSRLVDALLVLARSEERGTKAGDAVNLADLARDAGRRIDRSRAEGGIDGPDEALVRGDEDLLRIAVGNLLENAYKFGTGAAPLVVVRVQDGAVELRVTTPGARIDATERDLLFDRFYRGPAARANQAGHGLGLSLARHIARIHDGDVHLVSSPDQDPCFVLRMPLWRAS